MNVLQIRSFDFFKAVDNNLHSQHRLLTLSHNFERQTKIPCSVFTLDAADSCFPGHIVLPTRVADPGVWVRSGFRIRSEYHDSKSLRNELFFQWLLTNVLILFGRIQFLLRVGTGSGSPAAGSATLVSATRATGMNDYLLSVNNEWRMYILCGWIARRMNEGCLLYCLWMSIKKNEFVSVYTVCPRDLAHFI